VTREASRDLYAPGIEFAIDRITMLGNTGTYLDSPITATPAALTLPTSRSPHSPTYRRRPAGRLRPPRRRRRRARRARRRGPRGPAAHRQGPELEHRSVRPDAPYLARAGARWLADHGARLVGIDSVNIDDAADGERPAHSLLLAAGIPVVEHLTGLDQMPVTGARFTATPPRLRAFGTFPVRAFASVPGASPAAP
jgi:arylformamidase